ncbi:MULTISPECIES: S-adenosylmethionine synthetase N-terminal domain-containing protein [unclassified Gemella]|uniref:S-adenosylmethionine synthetase N-terminal domain-containing protein n=1 Tax=unclassified Gemella TaxID=2624949 RepID=UPI0010730E6B|nr:MULTISPECIES: S-adenosylmethionine synthetase N-terminal domain-containing protein [unclassified Gemella]MBF0710475.1 S-adenosylmethionine synthetase [Gemella sp. GL1.1]MBF0746583.1 S-adenosylmethionine synthetase [Gemella sp. 19428wG2_WT2a]NYS27819.1 S-adenosylmethionine synthetase [Gemella sp. GL1]TFU59942.1 S-adenosylmethionine synthetase [Gemella sp. WT2a]
MIEKVNPSHPDKLADRVAGAIVDLAYKKEENAKIAVEVLLGHGKCYAIIETTTDLKETEINPIIQRLVGQVESEIIVVAQDKHLENNQQGKIRCGDNGIFKGVPLTKEQKQMSEIARTIYELYPSDGKYILDKDKIIICQSKADKELYNLFPNATINPLGEWEGGINVDSGATNRKLGSDMADSVTGGGLHGKDLSKADVSVNIYAFLKAQQEKENVEISCAIGDEYIDGMPYEKIVRLAREYIKSVGGFEKFAEWGLV